MPYTRMILSIDYMSQKKKVEEDWSALRIGKYSKAAKLDKLRQPKLQKQILYKDKHEKEKDKIKKKKKNEKAQSAGAVENTEDISAEK